METIGFLELNSIAKGMEAADSVLKAAAVRLLSARAGCPGKYYLLFTGEVSAVQASLEAGERTGEGFVVDSCVIPRVHPQVIEAIAAATAPAATLMVVRQYKADGPLTRLLLLVVAIDDAVGLVLFSASFGVATALESGSISLVTVLVEPVIEIVLSLALGAVAGGVLFWVEKFFHSRSKRLSISIGFVLLTVGLSMVEFELGGIHFGFSLLLVCMMTGTIFCNICDFSEELMSRVDGWTAPLFVLFFVLSGAELNLKILSNPMVLLIGLVYIVFRSLGKYLGAYGSCALTGCSDSIKKHLGVTLLPQAGVALGMALTAQQLADGAVVRSVVLFSVLVYELVGPALTKRSLVAAGEIHEAGRTSARKKNEPKAPVQLDK